MHKGIEVYIDDMITKCKQKKDHVWILRKLFGRSLKYQLNLNLAKCYFGIKSKMSFGFIISRNGIEVDLDKIKAT